MTPKEVKEIRVKLGISQSELAKACNTHVGTIRKWERDSGQSPSGISVRLLYLLLDLKYMRQWQWFKKEYIERG